MSNEKIRQLLAKLQDEIESTEVDADTRSMMRDLDRDIHGLIGAGEEAADADSVVERARQLEAGFATSHPTIERVMREVIETLARMGI